MDIRTPHVHSDMRTEVLDSVLPCTLCGSKGQALYCERCNNIPWKGFFDGYRKITTVVGSPVNTCTIHFVPVDNRVHKDVPYKTLQEIEDEDEIEKAAIYLNLLALGRERTPN